MSDEPQVAQPTRTPSPRWEQHFCRECGASFIVDPEQRIRQSPHSREFIHRHNQHPEARTDYTSCSRYCKSRAQHEEVKQGRRLYGRGVAQPAPRTRYDDIFPEEKD